MPASKTRIRGDLAEHLGCAFGVGGSGPILQTVDQGEICVAGVFACGDIMRSAGKIALAIGDGSRVGIAARQSLIFG